jgi:FkbM family methyltransferase
MKHRKTALVVALLAITLAYNFWPQFRYAAWFALGRSHVCTFRQAMRSTAGPEDLKRVKDRILYASRLVKEEPGLELWNTPRGLFWIPRGNRYVLPFNLAEMELEIYGTGAHFVQPGDIVLDCGASDGDFARECLRRGAKLVVAIELSPAAIACLRRNLAEAVAAGSAIVYPKGVWDHDDVLTLNVTDDNFAANSVVLQPPGSHRDVRVPLTTIDRIVDELQLPRVDFIKMDVEGAEVKALAGARYTLSRYHPRMSIAAEHKPDDEITIPSAVRSIRGDYRMTCGPCSPSGTHIVPDVLYFE